MFSILEFGVSGECSCVISVVCVSCVWSVGYGHVRCVNVEKSG